MTCWEIIEADVLDALRTMPDASADGVLCDPPYGLGNREPTIEAILAYLRGEAGLDTGGDFMGAKWEVPPVAVWREVVRVLRPGAPVMVFAGTKTQDLISVGMRAGGIVIRDALDWLYGQGWSKSGDVGQKIDEAAGAERRVVGEKKSPDGVPYAKRHGARSGRTGGGIMGEPCEVNPATELETEPATIEGERWTGYSSALKPGREVIILGRTPIDGTLVENTLEHGVGALNIDGCRIEGAARAWTGARKGLGYGGSASDGPGTGTLVTSTKGRWPANVVLSHAEGCRLVGTKRVRAGKAHRTKSGGNNFASDTAKPPMPDLGYGDADGKETTEDWRCVDGCPIAEIDRQSGDRPGMSGGGAHREGYAGGMFGGIDSTETARGDHGGASRFFFRFHPKARAEKHFGCEHLGGNPHGCVKPIKITKWAATLVLPPPRADGKPRRILVLYAGSGSEMIGAMRAGWDEVVGVQRVLDDEERGYVAVARARLDRWAQVRPDVDEAEACSGAASEAKAAKSTNADAGPLQASLFGETG